MTTASEIHLESKAREIEKAEGLSYAKSYAKALEENPGLYALHISEVSKRDPAKAMNELRKAAERTAPKKPTLTEEEEKLEALARQRAKETGMPFAKAYSSVLETNEGAELYGTIVGGEYGR